MSFIIVLNSSNNYLSTPDRTVIQYLINFDVLPISKYIMTCSFISSATDNSPFLDYPSRSMLNIEIGGLPSVNYVAGSRSEAQITQLVGVAHQEAQPTDLGRSQGILTCSPYDNPPMYLPYRPSSNILTVRTFNADGITPFERGGFFNYIIRLYFTPID